ncbi:helix-turn-helix domain-containing protein [Alterisphingorhabdus coralli]|uniref:Helix-turn-helix transcriptional regulator n=1 Tax=Alterisphingorhabdus coralli TaxID=3071408 RepID=A0AA97I2E2_9SPHN|nr:helix-turn-helix transcriptional regulator [Parasphingorhabdus sp. SCSIO 66989]WOE76143.1 helix-turn-helix transcriptional regulator [Parasphingorhabdus sp. SCSIO 66989]
MPQNVETALTPRQIDCLRLVGKGMRSKEIALELGLAPSTVDNHIHAAVEKLGASDRFVASRMLDRENTRQKMPSQPAAIENSSESDELDVQAPQTAGHSFWRSLVSMPPLEGQTNDLSWQRRTLHILQIAIVAASIGTAIMLIIATVMTVII